jgi:hypothetical protein
MIPGWIASTRKEANIMGCRQVIREWKWQILASEAASYTIEMKTVVYSKRLMKYIEEQGLEELGPEKKRCKFEWLDLVEVSGNATFI